MKIENSSLLCEVMVKAANFLRNINLIDYISVDNRPTFSYGSYLCSCCDDYSDEEYWNEEYQNEESVNEGSKIDPDNEGFENEKYANEDASQKLVAPNGYYEYD